MVDALIGNSRDPARTTCMRKVYGAKCPICTFDRIGQRKLRTSHGRADPTLSGWTDPLKTVDSEQGETAARAWTRRATLLQAAADFWIVCDAVVRPDALAVLGRGIDTHPF
jgi:hypothetical protein